MRVRQVGFAALLAAGALALGTTSFAQGQKTATARAELRDAKGQSIGQVQLTETPNGVLIHGKLTNAPAGVHAFHIHQTGKCDPPSFDSAGGHFNPAKAMHGVHSEKGPHAGDLPNLHIPKDGVLEFEVLAAGVTLGAGPNSLFDEDGSALILHQGADDYRTDPTGNAGGRYACGVIER